MSTITDSFSMNITIIQHGIARIVLPVTYPSSVESGTPFDIVYTVKNDSAVVDNLYGRITVSGSELTGSAWTQNAVPSMGTITKTYHSTGITMNTTFVIEVGHS